MSIYLFVIFIALRPVLGTWHVPVSVIKLLCCSLQLASSLSSALMTFIEPMLLAFYSLLTLLSDITHSESHPCCLWTSHLCIYIYIYTLYIPILYISYHFIFSEYLYLLPVKFLRRGILCFVYIYTSIGHRTPGVGDGQGGLASCSS